MAPFQRRPVYWSPSSGTALAEAELEYDDHTSTAVYVRFPLHPSKGLQNSIAEVATSSAGANAAANAISALAWTTTPWTIPSNKALAINPMVSYSLAHVSWPESDSGSGKGKETFLVATDLVAEVSSIMGCTVEHVVAVSSDDILASSYTAPWCSSDSDGCGSAGGSGAEQPILPADYVTADSGTGVVHTAPV